jgi:hypothetical protein
VVWSQAASEGSLRRCGIRERELDHRTEPAQHGRRRHRQQFELTFEGVGRSSSPFVVIAILLVLYGSDRTAHVSAIESEAPTAGLCTRRRNSTGRIGTISVSSEA